MESVCVAAQCIPFRLLACTCSRDEIATSRPSVSVCVAVRNAIQSATNATPSPYWQKWERVDGAKKQGLRPFDASLLLISV